MKNDRPRVNNGPYFWTPRPKGGRCAQVYDNMELLFFSVNYDHIYWMAKIAFCLK